MVVRLGNPHALALGVDGDCVYVRDAAKPTSTTAYGTCAAADRNGSLAHTRGAAHARRGSRNGNVWHAPMRGWTTRTPAYGT